MIKCFPATVHILKHSAQELQQLFQCTRIYLSKHFPVWCHWEIYLSKHFCTRASYEPLLVWSNMKNSIKKWYSLVKRKHIHCKLQKRQTTSHFLLSWSFPCSQTRVFYLFLQVGFLVSSISFKMLYLVSHTTLVGDPKCSTQEIEVANKKWALLLVASPRKTPNERRNRIQKTQGSRNNVGSTQESNI